MARSIIGGLISNGHPGKMITATSPAQEELDKLAEDYGVNTNIDNKQALNNADVVVLAVKPQIMKPVCCELAEALPKQALVISIAAGISAASLEAWLETPPLVRCMPNTPALVLEGASGLFANSKASEEQKQLAHAILAAVGEVTWVETEALIDSVTAVSGSGPAYFFLMMEAMIEAGIKQGLERKTAETLAIQTALGAAKLAKHSDVDVAELRRRVTSPKGTTEQAINSFEANGFRSIVDQAMQACRTRAEELAEELGA